MYFQAYDFLKPDGGYNFHRARFSELSSNRVKSTSLDLEGGRNKLLAQTDLFEPTVFETVFFFVVEPDTGAIFQQLYLVLSL